MIKLCVFDLDGTLIDTLEDLTDSVNYVLEKHNLSVRTMDEIKKFVGNGILMLLSRAGEIQQTDPQLKTLYLDFMDRYSKHNADKTKPYGQITELLEKLTQKDILCAVLSNKDDQFVPKLVKRYFPDISFYHIQGNKKELPRKPDPTTLNIIVEKSGLAKEQCVYIGDSDVDVQTAHNAGIKCIGVDWGFRGKDELQQAGADFLAQKPFDILNFV